MINKNKNKNKNMKIIVFKTQWTYKEFKDILRDEEFSLKKYWFKRVIFWNILNSHWKIQYKTAEKLLIIYNDYYKSKRRLDTLFLEDKLLNYKVDTRKVFFEYVDDNNYTLFNFIDEVLSLA